VQDSDAVAHPLWPLVLVLSEIAGRIERRRIEEHGPIAVGERSPTIQGHGEAA
jgi:hypothetical protein